MSFDADSFSTGAMPFTLPEMVELASILRDVCLGLVELAYPETRAPTAFTFTKTRPIASASSSSSSQETKLWMHLFKVNFEKFLLSNSVRFRSLNKKFCLVVGSQLGQAAAYERHSTNVLSQLGMDNGADRTSARKKRPDFVAQARKDA